MSTSLDDALLDASHVEFAGRTCREALLQLVRREDVAEDVEDLVGCRGPSSISRIRSKSFWSTRPSRVFVGDEVEDEAVLLLAVAVDAAHALLQPHRVPRDVVVDHEPAELEVDAFAGGFGGDQDLAVLAELALGIDAGAGRVAVADLHAAVDLRDAETPLAQLAERPAIFAVASEVVERVLVLGEDEQLHLRIVEDALLGDEPRAA